MVDFSIVYINVLESSFCRNVYCVHTEKRNNLSNYYQEKFRGEKIFDVTFLFFISRLDMRRLFVINYLIIFHHAFRGNRFVILLIFIDCIVSYLLRVISHLFYFAHATVWLDHLMLLMTVLLSYFNLFSLELDVGQ